jgi:hypothetical protein
MEVDWIASTNSDVNQARWEKIINKPGNKFLDEYKLKCATLIVCGAPGSGKTSMVLSLLNRLKTWYDTIIVFVPTQDSNEEFAKLASKKRPVQVVNEFNIPSVREWVQQLDDHQKELREAGEPLQNVAVVVDDFAMDKQVVASGILSQISANRRHLNVTLYVLTQKLRAIPQALRQMTCTHLILCSLSPLEQDAVFEENEFEGCDRDTLKAIYRNMRREKPWGSFMCISPVMPFEKRVSINFRPVKIEYHEEEDSSTPPLPQSNSKPQKSKPK